MATRTAPDSEERSLAAPETEETATDGLEESFARPSYTGPDAGDNKPTNITENTPEAAPKGKGKVKGKAEKSFLKKHGAKIAVGGIGSAIIIPVLIFLFFLMIFKNVHIKQLYMDYEFAKFNRNFRTALRQAVDESQPEGKPDTAVPSDAAPDETMKASNAEEIDKLKADTQAFDEAARQTESLAQSAEGVGGLVDAELGFNRNIDDPAPNESDAKLHDATDAEFRKEVGGAEQGQTPPDAANAKDLAEEGKKLVAAGEGGPTLKENLAKFAKKGNSAMEKLSGPFIALTYMCIVRDIYVEGYKVYVTIKMVAMGNFAGVVAKYADCQKQGDCKLPQAAAISDQFDNGKDSFTKTASYKRVTNQPVTSKDPDLDPEFRPDYEPGGTIGTMVHLANDFNNLGFDVAGHRVSAGSACSVILSTYTQVAFVALNVGSTILGAATGVFTFGASDVAVIGVQAAAQIFATKAGKALATSIALHYGGVLFKQHFSPSQAGNLMGAGSKVLAGSDCLASGCPVLSPAANLSLMTQIRNDRVEQDKHRGLAYRLFSPSNPYSNISLAADAIPATPMSIVGSIQHFAATIFNPSNLAQMFNGFRWSPFYAQPAAADGSTATYGIPDLGFTDAQMHKWSYKDNSDFVRNNKSKYTDFISKCVATKLSDRMSDARDNKNPECTDSSDTYLQFRMYKFRQTVTHAVATLYSGVDAAPAASTTTVAPSAPGKVYIVGDSISVGLRDIGKIASKFPAAYQPVSVNGDSGRAINYPGSQIHQKGIDAIKADASTIHDANTVVVVLGTNYESNFPKAMSDFVTAIQATGTHAKIFWVNLTASRAGSGTGGQTFAETMGQNNRTISAQPGITVVDWFHQLFPAGDPYSFPTRNVSPFISADFVHPNTSGYNKLTDFIIAQVTSGR